MEEFFIAGKRVAIRVRQFKDGSVPVTAPSDALQLLTIKRRKGEVVVPHRHLPRKRVTKILQEGLVVMSGRIRVDLYDRAQKKCVRRIVVRKGEAIVLLGVPHAVHFLEDSLVYESKNGPFVEDKVPL